MRATPTYTISLVLASCLVTSACGASEPRNPYPANAAIDVPVDVVLEWISVPGANWDDVFFGTDRYNVNLAREGSAEHKGVLVVSTYDPGGLEPCTTYYWKIVASQRFGEFVLRYEGPVWSFTTGPAKASNPSPADGATCVPPDVVLSWTPGCQAIWHDVYMGTCFDDVNDANIGSPEYKGRQDANSYTPPETLEPDITYYWRVDGVNDLHADSPWKGNLWSFTGGSKADKPKEPKWTGLKVYYEADKKIIEEEPPGTGDNKWGEMPDVFVLEKDDFIWFAFKNDPDPDRKKYFQLALIGEGARNLTLVEEKGFEDGTNKNEIKAKTASPEFHGYKGKDYISRWRFKFKPQPKWERFKFEVGKRMFVPSKSITVRAWHMCCKTKPKKFKWPDVIPSEAEASGTIRATHDENYESYELSIWDASFLSQSPGAVIGDPRITDIYVFPDSSTVNALVPPSFSTDPSTGNWTASFVYTDPNGDSRPQGGVRFASDGPGLDTSDRFSLQIFLTGRIDSTYELYAYDQDSGQYMDFGIDVDIPECNDVVDDFESYTNDSGNRIFETWKDGRGYFIPPMTVNLGNGTGSSVDINSVTVYEGAQSMRFGYDNTGTGTNIVADPITVYYSETERTFDPPQDWTRDGVKALSVVWAPGHPGMEVRAFIEGPVGTYTMTATGADIFGESDEFHFAYRELTGSGSITAKVESLLSTDDWAKAGVMIRETLDGNSEHAMIAITGTHGVQTVWRQETGGSSADVTTGGVSTPCWIRIERVGDAFNTYYSPDGLMWMPQHSVNIPMGPTLCIGLGVCPAQSDALATAVFSNLTTSANVSSGWRNQDIGMVTNDPEQMYVAVEDNMGISALVNHPNPNAVLLDTWQEWNIDLREFSDAGVDLTNVRKMYIGVGDRDASEPGGRGTLYFDDIRLCPPH